MHYICAQIDQNERPIPAPPSSKEHNFQPSSEEFNQHEFQQEITPPGIEFALDYSYYS